MATTKRKLSGAALAAHQRRLAGGKPMRRAPTPRASPFGQVIVVRDQPTKRGTVRYRRTYQPGPAGGLRPVGRYTKIGRGTKKSPLVSVAEAVPGAALVLAGAAAVGKMVENHPLVTEASKKVPGGQATLILGTGLVGGWLAYKYRSLIAFLAALGLGAMAIIKFTRQGAKAIESGEFSDEDDSEDEGAEEGAEELPVLPEEKKGGGKKKKPTVQPAKPAPLPEDVRGIIESGDKAMSEGRFDDASFLYKEALEKSGDKRIFLKFGKAQAARAMAHFAGGQKTLAKTHATVAKASFGRFLAEATPTKTESAEAVDLMFKMDAILSEDPKEQPTTEELKAAIDAIEPGAALQGIEWIAGNGDEEEVDEEELAGEIVGEADEELGAEYEMAGEDDEEDEDEEDEELSGEEDEEEDDYESED